MKKVISAIIMATALSLPSTHLVAGHGDAAAGAAFGFLGGTILGSALSSRGSSRAERDVQQLRNEQQSQRINRIEQQSTTNMLLFVIAILFFGLVGLAIFVFKRKR